MIATNLEQAKEWFKTNSEPLTLQKDSVFTSVNSYDEAILFFYPAPEREIVSLQDEIHISNGCGLNHKYFEDLRLGKVWTEVSKELSEKYDNKTSLDFGTGGNMINKQSSESLLNEPTLKDNLERSNTPRKRKELTQEQIEWIENEYRTNPDLILFRNTEDDFVDLSDYLLD